MIDETRIVRNIKAVIEKIKKSKSWEKECIRTKDVVLMFETILDTIAESKVEQPTIQPQGIDKDRLIEELEELEDNKLMDIRAYSVMKRTLDLVKDIINQQPTTDGWIPVSERLPDEDMWCLVTYQSGEVEKVKYCTTNNWGQNDECITAWQPLP